MKSLERSQSFTFWNIWITYALFYFGKVNLGIIVPVLLRIYTDLSLINIGLVSSGFFFAYAIGQFLHGQISERFNPYIYIVIGLLCSGITNVFLGFAGSVYILLLVGETFDGFFQAMGWSSCVRANADLFKTDQALREKHSTMLGTSYQIGNSVAWIITALVVGRFGWRAGFLFAGSVLLLRALLLYLTMPKRKIVVSNNLRKQVKGVLSVPIVVAAVCLCLLNMVRFGIITWIPLYLFEKQNLTINQIGKVGLTVCLIPLAGVIGTLLFNRLNVKRNVLAAMYLIGLALSFVFLPLVGGMKEVILLIVGGFLLYGPHVFLVSTVPSRYLDKGVAAASTGFIDGMGYVGTILVGIVVPILVKHFGDWNCVFYFWGGLSVIIASATMVLTEKLK